MKGTGHRAQSTEHRAQSTGHRAVIKTLFQDKPSVYDKYLRVFS